MSYLRYCTLTGLDEATNLYEVARLSDRFAFIEWGVLFSRHKMSKGQGQGRYPREDWVRGFAQYANNKGLRCALHLCGQDAVDFLRGDKELMVLASQFGRVQINVKAQGLRVTEDVSAAQIAGAARTLKAYGTTSSLVVQHNENNAALWGVLRGNGGVEALLDSSAGTGALPSTWQIDPHEFLGARFGFAGGLGPDNIDENLTLIAAAAQGKSFWIDMESRLRDASDRFDLGACERVLESVASWQYQQIFEAARAAQENDSPPASVDQLSGLYLDWWAGLAMGYAMVIPPHNAARAVYLSRTYGEYESFQPSEKASELEEVIEEFGVGCIREAGKSGWTGLTSAGERVQSDTRKTAILRAAVLDAFGPSLPSNLAQAPLLHAVWLGSDVSRELLIGEAVKPGP